MSSSPQPSLPAYRGWFPRSRMGRLAALSLLLDLLLLAFQRLSSRFAGGTSQIPSLWILLFTLATGVLLMILLVRWVRRRLMWKLRNRLIITYIFIGVIPVVLLLLMGGLSIYLLGGQFATYIATADLRSELNGLAVVNARIAAELANDVPETGHISENLLRIANRRMSLFPDRATTVWYRDTAVTSANSTPVPPPRVAERETRSFVAENGRIFLRVAHTLNVDGQPLSVVSSVPIDEQLLARVAENLGIVSLSVLNTPESPERPPAPIRAGSLPPAANWLDRQITGPVIIPTLDWRSGQERTFGALLIVNTRPSLLKARLFQVVGESLNLGISLLTAVAIVFGIVELLALLIGIRLTRTMVRSVTELYNATQHVERGDLSYRIRVERDDQLAALERSFNSMTGSLQSLIAEQREKQRLDDDLAIAQEVQHQLFPRRLAHIEGLELHGICRPARTVSGDYYDFLPIGSDQLVIALGDVSGKGISAALLMATIHSAVRAYSLQDVPVNALAAVSAGPPSPIELAGSWLPGGDGVSPARLLCMLNRHLYRSTTPEKYATLFLAVYDRRHQSLRYANAGHLPPLLLRNDGSLHRLTSGGMVVGLFQEISFEEAQIYLQPGDLFVAFSDGVTEPENEFGEFGEARLIQLLRENFHQPLSRISEEITQAVTDWIGGGEQPDDLTLLLARPR
jgi:sigma-B regulation protein RsbU (phosphoserine phosphatase)